MHSSVVVCETHACLLGGSGGMPPPPPPPPPPPRKILNLHISHIASDAIWDKISEHFDDAYLYVQ